MLKKNVLKIVFLVTPTPSCLTDRDCADPHKCVDGTCRDACNVDPCGANAICKSRAHASSCSCPIGYTGNPKVQCLKSKFRFEKHLYCTRMLCYTFCMFQLHRTLCLSSHQNAETTQNVLCTMPASTGSVSTPVL